MINTKKIQGRRKVQYANYDDLLADAEKLAAGSYRTLGNWSFGQILNHLAIAIDIMIDGPAPFRFPAPLQWVAKKLMLKKMMTEPMKPGFKLPKKASALLPDEMPIDEAIARFRTAVARTKTETKRAEHGGFGTIERQEWDEFQLRHCEMHMSLVVPE